MYLFWVCLIISMFLLWEMVFQLNSPPVRRKYTYSEGYSDDFYVQHYDDIYESEARAKLIVRQIVERTKPRADAAFLDVGSGTGCVVHELHERGFRSYGIDLSKKMVDYAQKYPCEYICGDATHRMQFEAGTFSHILCFGTIHEIKDIPAWLRTVKAWLRMDGLFIVSVEEFDIPCARVLGMKTGARETTVEFENYSYKNKFAVENGIWTQTETFVEHDRWRENRKIMKEVSKKDLKRWAQDAGFEYRGEWEDILLFGI